MGALIQLELYTMSKPQKKIMVYVLNMRGEPLMPCSPVKARKLLQAQKAIVKRKYPFTIQLKVASGENRQPITLGVDPGYTYVGLSASTEKAELYAAEVELRPDVSKLLAQRRELRRTRRGRIKVGLRLRLSTSLLARSHVLKQ